MCSHTQPARAPCRAERQSQLERLSKTHAAPRQKRVKHSPLKHNRPVVPMVHEMTLRRIPMRQSLLLLLVAGTVATGCARQSARTSTPASASTGTSASTSSGTSGTSSTGGTSSTAAGTSSGTAGVSPTAERSRTATQTANTTPSSSSSTDSQTSVTGCLSKGETAEAFSITQESGQAMTVGGTPDLSKHVGHRVTLTGSREGGTFKVTRIQHLAANCSAVK